VKTSHRTRGDFPAADGVLTVRGFLAAVADRVPPRRPGETTPVWERFVPTTVRLADPWDESQRSISIDIDGSSPTAFITGIKIVDRMKRYPAARVQQVAVRTYLIPPALHSEIAERAAYLHGADHPLAVGPGRPDSEETIFRLLTAREQMRLEYIPPDEKVALAALMATRSGPAVAFSPEADWPRHPLVLEVAQRLERWFARYRLEEIPPRVLRRIRCVRYLPMEEEHESSAAVE
jgi:hypothetical protein